MIAGSVRRLAGLSAVFAIAVVCGSPARAQQVDCRFFKVTADTLSVYTEARGDSSFLGSLNRNDFVCVAGDQQVGDRKWAYVAYMLLGGDRRKTMDGWGIMSALAPATQDEIAALRNSRPPPGTFAEPPLAAPPRSAELAPADRDIVRWSTPIATGGYPVQGHSLEELVRGTPEFPPIDGLPEDIWHKTCNNCHQWNQQSLCVQARLYAQDPKMAFRKQHPYGGAEKTAMLKWAQGGCQ